MDAAASPAMAYMTTGRPRKPPRPSALCHHPGPLPPLSSSTRQLAPASWTDLITDWPLVGNKAMLGSAPGAASWTPTSPTRRRHEKSFMPICEPPSSACSLREHDRPTCHYQRDGKQLPKQNNRHPGRPPSPPTYLISRTRHPRIRRTETTPPENHRSALLDDRVMSWVSQGVCFVSRVRGREPVIRHLGLCGCVVECGV